MTDKPSSGNISKNLVFNNWETKHIDISLVFCGREVNLEYICPWEHDRLMQVEKFK